jgi:hypothetical protein
MKIKICEYCGNNFEGEQTMVYCSRACMCNACGFEIESKKCKNCGMEFETLTDAIYCSFECTYNLGEGIEATLP